MRNARSIPPTLVAVAHGSPDPRAHRAVEALVRLVRALRPGLRVELGHLEIDKPLLADTLARLRGEAVLVPLLFSRGYHVKHDIPAIVAGANSRLNVTTAACLGPHPLLAEALHSRLLEAGHRRGDAVILAAAGSLDPESAAGTGYTAQMLSARLGGARVLPAYASAASPTVAEAVERLHAEGHRSIAMASCFVAPGLFSTRCAEAAPGPVAAPLAPHPALARLLLHRYDQARDTAFTHPALAKTA
ncbi:sirohydrochlorin chelatase [Streptomyces radicis]|uniref:Sirohydrochlorin chelatase n=1 Tax=Streptomyces radicis TaxID=1750517 RepID=A0A3A9WI57_9ACTN|nr:sirohydrochlorin chelatase [Streptomyces radicis]RKN11993.1 sirohydrochlorin chelatase [Streptomyces radicis]RKN25956.1 sirohydrochlorin chelatase [Streptomyces radicis]